MIWLVETHVLLKPIKITAFVVYPGEEGKVVYNTQEDAISLVKIRRVLKCINILLLLHFTQRGGKSLQ